MRYDLLATAMALRDLKCWSLRSNGDRILMQMKVYLAQNFGLALGYSFVWGIWRPFSDDLARDAHTVIDEVTYVQEKFRNECEEAIETVNSFKHEKPEEMTVVEWYELLGFVVYFLNKGINEPSKMVAKIREVKPRLTERQITKAYKAYTIKHTTRK